jgi:alkylation response protein AidB-like acyl-CoA dehydrogenase
VPDPVVAAPVEAGELDELVEGLLRSCPPGSAPDRELLGARFDAGLTWPHLPVGCGGVGAPREAAAVVDGRLRAAGFPDGRAANPIGYGMAAPTLVAHGSDDQRRRHLRPIATGDAVWCQLFSEPGAGSDLASLATIARRDGDDWIVTGSKLWCSLADRARHGLLLARTDPDVEKHRGLTFFVLDLHAPGVTVRPLRHLAGDVEFHAVELEAVRIADADRVGEVDGGWSVALTTMTSERGVAGGASFAAEADPLALALDAWRASGTADPVVRDRLARLWIGHRVLALTAARATPAEGSLVKLLRSELLQRTCEFCVDVRGAAGMLGLPYDPSGRTVDREDPAWRLLRSRSFTIGGGTSEVQRTMVGERLLGLPAEARADKGRPWSAVPRSVDPSGA